MTAVGMWIAVEWRQRWKALVGLVVLIAFATAAVSASLAGARRGASVVDRLLDRTAPATAAILPNAGSFDWEAVRSMPGVEAVAAFAVAPFLLEDVPGLTDSTNATGFPFIGGDVWTAIERPVVLDGRIPDLSRADEVAVTTTFRDRFGLGVGDRLTLRLYTAEQLDAYEDAIPAGPIIRATIVGVIRSPWFSDEAGTETGRVFPSPGLHDRHPENVVGTSGAVNVNAIVRLADDVPLAQFLEDFASRTGVDNAEHFDLGALADDYRDLTTFEARALLLLAVAALAAGAVLVGVATSRYVASSFSGLEVLRSFGLDRRSTIAAAAAAPLSAAVAGGLLGAMGAWWASGWFPIGSASSVEPAPGRDVDPLTTSLALVMAPLLVCIVSVVSAGRRRTRSSTVARTTRIENATSSWPIAAALGARYALAGRSSRNPVSSRPAVVAATVAVIGVSAALTFAGGIADATNDYERFGQTYDASAFWGAGGADAVDITSAVTALTSDSAVRGVIDARNDVAQSSAGALSLFTYDAFGDDVDVVVLDGRLPGAGEVAVAPLTARDAGLEVGDEVSVQAAAGPQRLRVSGVAFVPAGPHNSYASGGWITADTFDEVFDAYRFRFGLIWVASGEDVSALGGRIGDFPVRPGPVLAPVERAELAQLRTIPLYLAGFLAVLGTGAVAHSLASTARRRRHDVAMLRALGMRPRQTAWIVYVQAAVMAGVGTVIGLPVGVAIGRAAWRSIALDAPVEFVVPNMGWALMLVLAAVGFLALTFSFWPSRRLARMHLGSELRYE